MEKNENIGTSDCASPVKMVEAPESKIYLDFKYQQYVEIAIFIET